MARRTGAYQAFYEHMPLRLAPPGQTDFASWRMFQRYDWGRLARQPAPAANPVIASALRATSAVVRAAVSCRRSSSAAHRETRCISASCTPPAVPCSNVATARASSHVRVAAHHEQLDRFARQRVRGLTLTMVSPARGAAAICGDMRSSWAYEIALPMQTKAVRPAYCRNASSSRRVGEWYCVQSISAGTPG